MGRGPSVAVLIVALCLLLSQGGKVPRPFLGALVASPAEKAANRDKVSAEWILSVRLLPKASVQQEGLLGTSNCPGRIGDVPNRQGEDCHRAVSNRSQSWALLGRSKTGQGRGTWKGLGGQWQRF